MDERTVLVVTPSIVAARSIDPERTVAPKYWRDLQSSELISWYVEGVYRDKLRSCVNRGRLSVVR